MTDLGVREGFVQVESARLVLRRLTEADLPVFVAYRADPEVARYQNWESFTEADGLAFFTKQQGLEPGTPGRWFEFALEAKDGGALVGDVALHVREDDPRQGEIGYTVAPAHQGRGYGREAVERVLGFAFEELGLHRVIAITDALNTSSARLLERVGMRREGHFLQNIWFKGAWGDEFSFAMLREEWMAR